MSESACVMPGNMPKKGLLTQLDGWWPDSMQHNTPQFRLFPSLDVPLQKNNICKL